MTRSGTWRVVMGAAAIMAGAACGSDQSTNSPPPPSLTAAQLALHFDSLAQRLNTSSPGDVRIQWLQEMVRVLARGASPRLLAIREVDGPAEVQSLTEIDQFPTQINANLTADSTYILTLYNPPLSPLSFADVHVWFLPNSGGADTTRTLVTLYLDTLGHQGIDSTAVISVGVVGARGACQTTALAFLTVPDNPCIKTDVEWSVAGGAGLLTIDPALQISGVRFTATP